jgi:hypothetical protein
VYNKNCLNSVVLNRPTSSISLGFLAKSFVKHDFIFKRLVVIFFDFQLGKRTLFGPLFNYKIISRFVIPKHTSTYNPTETDQQY